MSRFSLFRWGKSKSDSDRTSRAGDTDRFVADGVDRKKNSSQKNSADDPQLPQKKRARRRLVGSITLVVAAIIVLPMIFESEPKPVSPNLQIDIPSRDKPAQIQTTEQTSQMPTTETAVAPASDQVQQQAQAPSTPVATDATTATPPVQQSAPTQLAAANQSVVAQHAETPKDVAQASDADKQKKQAEAQLKAEKARQEKLKAEKARQEKAKADKQKADAAGSDPIGQMIADKNAKTTTSGKQLIQVAALTSQQKVNELQAKLSKAGILSHTQKVKSKNGEERIRVRVGPLSKSDADKTCSKLKGMGLSCTLLPN